MQIAFISTLLNILKFTDSAKSLIFKNHLKSPAKKSPMSQHK